MIIGSYQMVTSMTGAASAYTLFFGRDVMNRRVSGMERFMALIDLATNAAMTTAGLRFSWEMTLTRTTPRIQRSYPTSAPAGKSIKQAPAGTLVRNVEEFGMTREQGLKFQRIVDEYAEYWGHDIDIWIRPTNVDSLPHIKAGHPGKPEPIKSKSINKQDIEGGWAQGEDGGFVGYFDPEQVQKALGVRIDTSDLSNLPKTPPAGVDVSPAVWKRGMQRIREFYDEAPMMNDLKARGLVEIDGNGVCIDRGISGYRLEGEHHALVAGPTFKEGGTGLKIAGDPDPFVFTDGNGTRLPAFKQEQLLNALQVNGAGVKHGGVVHWKPHEAKNLAIQRNILDGHAGQVVNGQVVPKDASVEGLIVFRGSSRPLVTGYGGQQYLPIYPLPPARLNRPLRITTVVDPPGTVLYSPVFMGFWDQQQGWVWLDSPESAPADALTIEKPPYWLFDGSENMSLHGWSPGLFDRFTVGNKRWAMLPGAALLLVLAGLCGAYVSGTFDSTDTASVGSGQQTSGQPAAVAPIVSPSASTGAAAPSQAPAVAPSQAPAVAPSQQPAVAPSQPPAVVPSQVPAGRTNQQLMNANINANDVDALYGACAHEFTAQNLTDVQQAVSSSQPMVAAMGTAGYTGFRSASRAPTPCQGMPYNIASVMGNASSVAAADALLDAAKLNYGQVLFTNVAPFSLVGPWDESYCQSGVYPPAGNIIAVACWVRKGSFIGGSFVLLPPGSAPNVIMAASNGSSNYWQRVAAVVQ